MDYHSWRWRSFRNSLFCQIEKSLYCQHVCSCLCQCGGGGGVIWRSVRGVKRTFWDLIRDICIGTFCRPSGTSMCLRKRLKVQRPLLFPVSFKYQRSETEREIDEESTSQGMMKPHPSPSLALPLACAWLTVGVKITLEWCLLCHWLTLSRIMDNHHRNRRAAHWCCGVPQWGRRVEVRLFGCHHQWDDMLTDV